MTDNEIIKALKCCEVGKDKCKKCPLYCTVPACSRNLAEFALDLINRQNAEIERLQEKAKKLGREQYKFATAITDLKDDVATAKSEAVKEFAERLKKQAIECDVSFGYGRECFTEVVTVIEVDKVLKEMTE